MLFGSRIAQEQREYHRSTNKYHLNSADVEFLQRFYRVENPPERNRREVFRPAQNFQVVGRNVLQAPIVGQISDPTNKTPSNAAHNYECDCISKAWQPLSMFRSLPNVFGNQERARLRIWIDRSNLLR
jgi:hypothetical protein